MRSDFDILQKLKELENDPTDFFGFMSGDLLQYLGWENVRPFLKPETTEEQWKQLPCDDASIKQQIHDYMTFAWDKANNCRGLSAARSLNHMQAWLWMLHEDNAANGLEDYSHYGKPELRAICEHFGWDWTQWDDGHWSSAEEGPYIKPEEVELKRLDWNRP